MLTGALLADDLRLDARAFFERSVTRNVKLNADGSAIELETGELFEDDGPAAGFTYRANEETISDRSWIKKELIIPIPAAKKAFLLIGPGGNISARINGRDASLQRTGKAGGYWETYSFSPDVLKAGKNEIVIRGPGRVWIARAEDFASGSSDRKVHPNRSARSSDGGTTWDFDRLGPRGDIDGEYYVRVFLEQYRTHGSLKSQVIDLGNLAERAIGPPISDVGPVHIQLQVDNASKSTRVDWKFRSGTTAAPDDASWSAWRAMESPEAKLKPAGRYIQLAVELVTSHPMETPRLQGVRIQSAPKRGIDWVRRLKVVEQKKEKIVRSSIPFQYERHDHPRLQELRAKFKLDEVVKGAADEFEVMTRLAQWSARQWQRGHLNDAYPPWDALEILKLHSDGTPVGGFCQQYNLVFLQACESLGIPGRAVSIGVGDHGGSIRGGGHEVVELWSNQFRKWVYVDGNMAWYAVDGKSNLPLSLRELRQRQLLAVANKEFPAIRIVELLKERRRWTALTDWPPFLELRLIPRSNFLEQRDPLPLHQGMRGWFWTGHHVWDDATHPCSMLYAHRVSDERNWDWTLNQVHFELESTASAGSFRVQIDTETPGLSRILAAIDGKDARPVQSGFEWRLHSGTNRLEIYPQNIAGRDGIRSFIVIENP